MTRIFQANSMYHMLLSNSLNKQLNGSCESYLFSSPSFQHSTEIISIFRDSGSFDNIIELKGFYKRSGVEAWTRSIYNSLRAAYLTKKISPRKVFVCNDLGTVGQSMLRFCSNSCLCTHIEDGSAAYNSSINPPKEIWKKILGKLVYGTWWSPSRVFGTDNRFNQIAAIFPQYIRPELNEYKSVKINPDSFNKSNQNMYKKIIDEFDAASKIENLEVLVLAPHSSTISLDEKNKFQSIIKEQQRPVGIKYHPRDNGENYLDVGPQTVTIPSGVPSEVLYGPIDNLKLIIGGNSTSLLTARWLLNKIDIVCISGRNLDSNDRIVKVMAELGIKFN